MASKLLERIFVKGFLERIDQRDRVKFCIATNGQIRPPMILNA